MRPLFPPRRPLPPRRPDPPPAQRQPDLPSALKPHLGLPGETAAPHGEDADNAFAQWLAHLDAGHFKPDTA